MLQHIYAVYFSPTGGTKACAKALADALAKTGGFDGPVEEIDLSADANGYPAFTEDDIAVIAMPVFGGRIPAYAAEKLLLLNGGRASAVTAAVYGNRAYEDALLELNDVAEKQGFVLLSSTALLAEHSMVHTVAAGRPDEADHKMIAEFADKIMKKWNSQNRNQAFKVPGNRPYKEWKQMPFVPTASDSCIGCGICADLCPTQAIPKNDLKSADPAKCILCMRCTTVCPEHARALPAQAQAMIGQKLAPCKEIRRENELYL